MDYTAIVICCAVGFLLGWFVLGPLIWFLFGRTIIFLLDRLDRRDR